MIHVRLWNTAKFQFRINQYGEIKIYFCELGFGIQNEVGSHGEMWTFI